MNSAYSIWILPPAEIGATLRTIITDLSERYDGPVFDPHVTLLGSIKGTEHEVTQKFRQLAQSVSQIEIVPASAGHGSDFYRCVFLRVEYTRSLKAAFEEATRIFGQTRHSKYEPHLSLLYGSLPEEQREKAIESLDGDIEPFMATELQLMASGGEVETWYEVDRINVAAG